MARAGQDWLLVHAPDGGIAGVASRSTDKPRKTANFPPGLERFSEARAYSEWVFEYVPPSAPTGGRAGATADKVL